MVLLNADGYSWLVVVSMVGFAGGFGLVWWWASRSLSSRH